MPCFVLQVDVSAFDEAKASAVVHLEAMTHDLKSVPTILEVMSHKVVACLHVLHEACLSTEAMIIMADTLWLCMCRMHAALISCRVFYILMFHCMKVDHLWLTLVLVPLGDLSSCTL